ncbi:MAG: methyltransferase family protein [Mangrovibacterium sp.]
MTLHTLIIILAFVPLISSLLLAYQTMRAGFSIWGKASIASKWLYYFAKTIAAIALLLTALASLVPQFYLNFAGTVQMEVPFSQRILAVVFLLAGNLLLLLAQYELSIFTRIGLPQGKHALCTSGVYALSRNPMYTSLIFFFIACFLLNPNLILALVLAASFVVHCHIIRREEEYLSLEFGEEYEAYRSKTAKFL